MGAIVAAEVLETHVAVSIRAPVMGAIHLNKPALHDLIVSIRAPVMGAICPGRYAGAG